MEVPRLFEIIYQSEPLISKSVNSFWEINRGDPVRPRSIHAQVPHSLKERRSLGSDPFLLSQMDTASRRQSIIQGHGMYNFLVRFMIVMCMLGLDSQVAIEQGNCIKCFMVTEFCEFSPEIKDHFEIFENISGFDVTIVTSAS
jgi:hypothetical protein